MLSPRRGGFCSPAGAVYTDARCIIATLHGSKWHSAPSEPQARVQRGQAFAEMALVATVLAILVLGIFEVVSLFSAYTNVGEATRAGARLAGLNYSDGTTIDRVLQTLDSHHLNTAANSQCDVREIDIYEAADRNNVAPSVPVPMQQYFMYPGTDTYGGACTQSRNASYIPHFDQITRNVLATAAQGQEPATVGVRIIYNYHFRTPILGAFGTTRALTLSSVFPMGGDNANNYQNMPVNTPPVPPAQPNPPVNQLLSADPFPVGVSVISPTLALSPTSTISTTGVVTGTGTITGTYSPVTKTYTYTPTGTLWSSQPFVGTGVLTATATSSISTIESLYDPYDPGAPQATHGYTITWTWPITTTTAPTGFLVYIVHNGVATHVPGVYPSSPVPYTAPGTYTYPWAGLDPAYKPYQPYLVPGDSFYVTSVNNGVESVPPPQSQWLLVTLAASPVRPPPTYAPPPENFQATVPSCGPDNTYPPQLGVRLTWDPVPGATGYMIKFVHNSTATDAPGTGPTSPWTTTVYPSTGSLYGPTFASGDYWKVSAVVSGVTSSVWASTQPLSIVAPCAAGQLGS